MRANQKRWISIIFALAVVVFILIRIFGTNSIGFIDSPEHGQTIADVRELIVSGWAADPEGVEKLEVVLDSRITATAFHGIVRPDVVAAAGDKPGYLNSGFRVALALPESVGGEHTLDLVVIDGEGKRSVVDSKTIIISTPANSKNHSKDDRPPVMDNSRPALGFIDTPVNLDQLESTDNLLVMGWVVDPDGVKDVQLVLDNGERVSAQTGIEREDVQRLYPQLPDSLRSGFRAKVDLPEDKDQHHIRLFVVDHLDNRRLVDRVRFTVLSEVLAEKEKLIKATEADDLSFRSKGFIDRPAKATRVTNSKTLNVAGWTVDADGIESVQVTINDRLQSNVPLTIKRPDVHNLYDQVAGSLQSGFEAGIPIAHLDSGDHTLAIFVTDRLGHRVKVAEQDFSIVSPSVWSELLDQRPALKSADFSIAIATSHLAKGGGAEIKETFAAYESETIRTAVRVPILYMRTTEGKENDWVFDPGFDVETEQNGLVVAEDALQDAIQYAMAEQLPLVFTLNGGIWSDARGGAPEWDLTDYLEQDVLNCQWNEGGQVMPDDYLSRLPGSESNPQLARALTFNYYAETVRKYKKRNLQQAGRLIKAFKESNPGLFLAVNLDPDVYLNPFFHGEQTYDYNPGTVRQFQEWLSGRGPYAKGRELHQKRRSPTLSLNEFNQLTGKNFSDWSALKPPSFSKLEKLKALFNHTYIELWQQFRRHLVDLHYDDLSRWLNEAGIGPRYIYSSQGFAADMDPEVDVFPVAIDSPPVRHDTGGVSIEGAIPSGGHLGAIFYGRSTINQVTVETGNSLFAEIRERDPDWAVVEFNPAYLEYPNRQSDYRAAYRAFRDMFNFGARFVSPMAWNGWNGIYKDDPGYLSYTSFRNTPLEKVVKDFMVVYADVPRGMLLWPFGTHRYADSDGWQVNGPDFRMRLRSGRIQLRARPGVEKLVLDSPKGQVIELDRFDTLVLGMAEREGTLAIQVRSDGNWVAATESVELGSLSQVEAGLLLALKWRTGLPEVVSQIRLIFHDHTGFESPVEISHIALYPKAPTMPVVDEQRTTAEK